MLIPNDRIMAKCFYYLGNKQRITRIDVTNSIAWFFSKYNFLKWRIVSFIDLCLMTHYKCNSLYFSDSLQIDRYIE